MANQFSSALIGGQLSEMASLSAKIGQAVCSGSLSNNAVCMGMILQMIEAQDRSERGVDSLKKPRKMTDLEQGMVQDAGGSWSCAVSLLNELCIAL